MPSITPLLRLLQFGDSMLPVGAFSFSNGLEAAVAQRVVHDAATLRAFVRTALDQAAGADGIALLAAHRAASASDETGSLRRIRRFAAQAQRGNADDDASHGTQARRARFAADARSDDRAMARRSDHAATPGTLPVALALAFAASGLPEREAFAAHQYGVATMMLGAALRLMKLSYLDGQGILHEVNGDADAAFARIATAGLDDMATFAPLTDILAAIHVKSHVRMFMN